MIEPTPENLTNHLEELAELMLTEERLERLETVARNRMPVLTAAFEDLYDPHNVCAGVRSCEVFGCPSVHVISAENAFNINHTTAKNATRWVDIQRYKSTKSCIDTLHDQGFTVIGTLPEGKAVPFTEFELPEKLCIFMGRESTGMTEEAIAMCDAHVTIPQFGFTQSLNISVALAVILQHFSHQYRISGRDVLLSDEDRKKLLDAWIERDLRRKMGWQG